MGKVLLNMKQKSLSVPNIIDIFLKLALGVSFELT